MNISRTEQRVLHVLAQGGRILHERGEGRKVTVVSCLTRDGHLLEDCDVSLFRRLLRRRLIRSQGGNPYQISHLGRLTVRSQPDNR